MTKLSARVRTSPLLLALLSLGIIPVPSLRTASVISQRWEPRPGWGRKLSDKGAC